MPIPYLLTTLLYAIVALLAAADASRERITNGFF